MFDLNGEKGCEELDPLGSHLSMPRPFQPEFVNVCFWFVPPSLRGKKGSPDYHEKLAKVSGFHFLLNLDTFVVPSGSALCRL